MSHVRSLLARVQRLERTQAAPRSPFEIMYGSFEAWQADVQKDIDAGKLDSREMPQVLEAIRSWHTNNVYGAWFRRGQVWGTAGRNG